MLTFKLLKTLALCAGLVLGTGAALAQSVKPVNLMVPYPAGGPSDAVAAPKSRRPCPASAYRSRR